MFIIANAKRKDMSLNWRLNQVNNSPALSLVAFVSTHDDVDDNGNGGDNDYDYDLSGPRRSQIT